VDEFLDKFIPKFESEGETCPKKGAFASSVFLIFLLDNDVHKDERRSFIEGVIDTMLPPPLVDKLTVHGKLMEFDLNYYVLKAVYKRILARRPLVY
jgi:hypothetical protein